MLTTILFACAEFGACTSTPTPPPPPPVTAPAPAPAEDLSSPTLAWPLTFVVYEDGSVRYSDGAVKCVTGAPCDTHDLPSSAYTYDWETGIAYGGN